MRISVGLYTYAQKQNKSWPSSQKATTGSVSVHRDPVSADARDKTKAVRGLQALSAVLP